MPVEVNVTDVLHTYFNKYVIVNVDTGKDATGSDTFETIEGKAIAASEAGLVVRNRGTTRIIEPKEIIDIEETPRNRRPKRVVRRVVRVFGTTDDVRQHLADRHGVLVSVLNNVSPEDAGMMHANIKHDDLGHRHGDRVLQAEAAMQALDVVDLDEMLEGEDEDSTREKDA